MSCPYKRGPYNVEKEVIRGMNSIFVNGSKNNLQIYMNFKASWIFLKIEKTDPSWTFVMVKKALIFVLSISWSKLIFLKISFYLYMYIIFLRIFIYWIPIVIFSCMYKLQIFNIWYLFCKEYNSFICAWKCCYITTLSVKGFLNPFTFRLDIHIFYFSIFQKINFNIV